ncbi:FAS1 domain-containing protein [Xylaria sp. FL1777]|nr:FAS1 domain-containing protein [Xylaria sp. FL1777]
MRYTNLLPFAAALATAIVVPDEATAQQLGLEVAQLTEKAEKAASGWWDSLRSASEVTIDSIDKKTHRFIDQAELLFDTDDADDVLGMNWPGHRGRPGRRHGPLNLTIYEAIQASNRTKKFAALINDFPDLVDLLNSTETNSTVFLPLDKAFEKIPEHGHKPPKEFIQKILEYHVLPGSFPAGRVLASHTLPTALKSEALGGRPQRLRVGLSLFGLKINFFSKVIATDIFVKNGICHAVDHILLPPPPAGRLISLFPSKFSTLELAAAKTGLLPHHKHHDKDGKDGDDDDDHKHHGFHTTGLTIFAPTNAAFARLGPAANAFLFNTERGLGFLRALLKYHIVVNETLYSDAYYGVKDRSEDLFPQPASVFASNDDEDGLSESESGGQQNGHFHVDLPTLLEGKSLSIDIARFYGLINIRINGYAKVAVEDGVALDGVVQVVSSVLFPPRKAKSSQPGWTERDGEIPVEELIDILQPYVDEEEKKAKSPAGGNQVWGEL